MDGMIKMLVDYKKDGAVNTIKTYSTARVVPSRKITEFGTAILRNGRYILPGIKYVALARVVYKKYHGKIPKGYDIHHIDGDRLNDEPDNLVALSHEEHIILHENMSIAHQAIEVIRVTNAEAKELYKNEQK